MREPRGPHPSPADPGATHTVRVERMGERAVGIAHLPGGKALLIPYSAPGDVAVVRLEREGASWARGRIVELLRPSPDRVNPPCPYYTRCGGCSLQHLKYERQLEYKRALLEDVYRAFGAAVEPVEPSPRQFAYRNKLQMQAGARGGRLVAGFYRVRSHEIVAVERCLLQSEAANALARDAVATLDRRGVRAWRRGGGGELRDLVIRESLSRGELTLTLVAGANRLRDEDELSRELFSRHAGLRGLYLYHNPHETEYVFRDGEQAGRGSRGSPLRRIHGRSVVEDFAGLELETSPISFFQANPAQAERIVERMRAILGSAVRSVLVDAYAGVGALSLPLAPLFRRIVAVEAMRQSCELARVNAARNGVRGYRVLHGEAAFVIERALAGGDAQGGSEDGVLLVDPPRTGLGPRVSRQIARSGFPLILYLSCDPRTQARDLGEILRGGLYRLREIRPFDMFPQTFHLECLAVLERSR